MNHKIENVGHLELVPMSKKIGVPPTPGGVRGRFPINRVYSGIRRPNLDMNHKIGNVGHPELVSGRQKKYSRAKPGTSASI